MKKMTYATYFFLALFLSVPAWAGSILESPIDGGHVGYGTGNSGFLKGTGIKITELSYGPEMLSVIMGRLTFTIPGDVPGRNGGNWFLGPEGKFTVSGWVDLKGKHDVEGRTRDFHGILMTGTFLSEELVKEQGQTVLIAKILERINPEVAALLHLPRDTFDGELELRLVGGGANGFCIRGGQLEGFPSLPEPASIFLLGPSLVGLAVGLLSLKFRHPETVRQG